MNEPLPPDIVDPVLHDFTGQAQPVLGLLSACRRVGGPDYFGDRLVRCVVFAARGDESRIRQLIELGRQDFRNVIMAAEYDVPGVRRLRDFNRPFESAELS
jgi:hypothetical protein